MAVSVHGRQPNSSSVRTIVLKSHVRMISWAWGRRSMGNTREKRSGSSTRRPAICGRERRRGPGVHDVGVADEPTGLTPLVVAVPVGDIARRVDRQAVVGGEQGVVVVDRAVAVHRVPHREGHAEEALPADVPVPVQALHPRFVAVAHVRRVPAQLAAPLEQPLAQVERSHVPLPAGDDLEGPIAALVELDRVSDRLGLADQGARRRRASRRCASGPGSPCVPRARRRRVAAAAGSRLLQPVLAPRHRSQPPVAADDGARRQ